MLRTYTSANLQLALALFLTGSLSACGSDSSNGQTVTVNLSLIIDARQAQHSSISSRLVAWMHRWLPGATLGWAQSVDEIANIQVQITGPGISSPATASVPVSNPTSGQEIPISIRAPVGPNRTITVTAFNAESPPRKLFGSTLTGVNLTLGPPISLEMVLVRLFIVTVRKHAQSTGDGTVTSLPSGINCGTTCSGEFEAGTAVSLNAAAAPGSVFAGWSGGCSGSGPCSATDTATITARFNVAIATGGFPEGTVVDDFNRANESPVVGWTNINGANSAIVSNQWTVVTGCGGNDCAHRWAATTYNSVVDISVDIPTEGAPAFYGVRLLADHVFGSWDGYDIAVVPGTSEIHIEEWNAGSGATMGSAFSQNVSNGDSIGLRVDTSNGNISLYYKPAAGSWTLVGTRNDATPISGPFHAVLFTSAGNADGGPLFDNFRVGTVPTSAR